MTKEQIQTRTRILHSLGCGVTENHTTALIGGMAIPMGTCWPTRLAVARTLIFKAYELGQIQGKELRKS